MSDTADLTHIIVTAHAKPALTVEPVDSKLERLRALETAGRIDEVAVNSWPQTVDITSEKSDETDYPKEAVATYRRIRQWANSHGVAVDPYFERELRIDDPLGELRTIRQLPAMTLEISVKGRIVGAFPHTDGEHEYTVADAIAALETGSLTFARTVDDHHCCPDCGDELASVLGIDLCRECGWDSYHKRNAPVVPTK